MINNWRRREYLRFFFSNKVMREFGEFSSWLNNNSKEDINK